MSIITHVEDQIGWITINRPELRNAISKEMWDALPDALTQLSAAGARVIVFQGHGEAFAAGADLAELEALGSIEEAREHWLSIRSALNAVAAFSLPTIAMINGPCMGGGCLLACACDIRICEPSARFSVPVAQLGIVLDDDNIRRLITVVGRGFASQLLFTAEPISAARAEQIGLINTVVPAGTLQQTAVSLAESIKRNAAGALTQTKQAIARLSGTCGDEQDQDPMVASYLSDEFRSRVAKALSKKS